MPLILGTNSIKDTGYNVANSLRFNDGSSDYLDKSSYGTPTSQKKFTWSCWFKIGETPPTGGRFFDFWKGSGSGFSYGNGLFLTSNSQLGIGSGDDNNGRIITNRVFRDPSAWYHVVAVYDSPNSTAGDRLQLYVNGVRETSFSANVTVTQNQDYQAFTSNHGGIGTYYDKSTSSEFFDGYMAEVVFIDGLALTPTSFGEFDEDSPTIWKPIDVSGLTFGTNGFYLDFEDSSALGNDVAGSNNFTANNLTAIDQSLDTCTNNFATINPLTIVAGASLTLSEGNLTFNGTSTDAGAKATFGVSSGKWYWEVKVKMSADGSSGSDRILVATENVRQFTSATDPNSQGIWGIQSRGGSGATLNSYTNGTFSNVNSGSAGFNNTDIIGVALDADNGKLYFSINGTFKDLSGNTGNPANATNPTFTGLPTDGTFLLPYVENRVNVTPSSEVNFGGTQSFTISSGNTDGNGFGNFEYEVPSGYFSLCTKNLAENG
jgi:hypothetical protein